MDSRRIYRIYIVPPVVFQSVCIAGGYGTGREIAEFFTQYGSGGGLYGLLAATLILSLIVALTFEFARRFRVYDYRSFFRELLGPFWWLFEVLYLITLLLVLAVIGSASGSMLRDRFGLSNQFGLFLMLGFIAFLVFFGRDMIARIFTGWSIVFFLVLALLGFYSFSLQGGQILAGLSTFQIEPGWFGAAFRFCSYSTVLAIVTLFATRSIETPRQAVLVGTLSVLLSQIPAFIFHLSFLARYPEILTAEVPVDSLITSLEVPFLSAAYTIALFGTFVETGAGFIQTLNERVDLWFRSRLAPSARRWFHALLALAAVTVSLLLAQVGIVALVAEGYGNLVWGYLVVFIAPLLTIGLFKILRSPGSKRH